MIIILYFTCIYVSCFRTSCSYTPHGISSYTRQDYICVCHAEKRKAYNTNIKISMWIVQKSQGPLFFHTPELRSLGEQNECVRRRFFFIKSEKKYWYFAI